MALFSPRDSSLSPNAEIHGITGLGLIMDIKKWQSLLTLYKKLKKQYAPYRILITLDDEGQAQYTSTHAGMAGVFCVELDDDGADDNAIIAKQVKHYAKTLNDPSHQVSLTACSNKMNILNDDDKQTLIFINENPLPILDRSLSVFGGEFDSEALKLSLLLNGYFQGDFSPFENLAIIHLMADFGFEFMGIGASLLGFIKTDGFCENKLPDLIDSIATVYHLKDEHRQMLMRLWQDNNYAILSYSESPSELMDFY